MYAFDAIRPAYERMWGGVVARVPDLPPTLTWPDDVHTSWTEDAFVVKQACGWPLVTRLAATVRVVGAFEHDVAGAEGHRYRSVIVSNRGPSDRVTDPADVAGSTVAYNSADSLSGWISLLAWMGESCGPAVETGSHLASLAMLRADRASIASIDSVTLAHVRRHDPDSFAGLHVIGSGPLVPSLPVIVPASLGDDAIARLRRALGEVIDDDSLADTRRELLTTGFVPLDLDDYRRDLRHLTAAGSAS